MVMTLLCVPYVHQMPGACSESRQLVGDVDAALITAADADRYGTLQTAKTLLHLFRS